MSRISVPTAPMRMVAGTVALVSSVAWVTASAATSESSRSIVVANNNRTPAGELEGGTLKLTLRAAHGSWQPEGPDGPRLSVEAFGEGASPLSVPAPLIRATAGTSIEVLLRNDLDRVLQGAGAVRP